MEIIGVIPSSVDQKASRNTKVPLLENGPTLQDYKPAFVYTQIHQQWDRGADFPVKDLKMEFAYHIEMLLIWFNWFLSFGL